MDQENRLPENNSNPTLRSIAMPADTNPSGDIFGGWLLSQMDLAGGVVAAEAAAGRVVTVGIEAMTFHKPVFVGDEVTCYAKLKRIGNTSVTVQIDSWARRYLTDKKVLVTEGCFTYVALDENRKPRIIKKT